MTTFHPYYEGHHANTTTVRDFQTQDESGGGVGSLAVQLAKRWDAGRVIAVASTPEKRELALSLGADVAVDSNASDLNTALREANGGAKVDVVLEMVGGATFDASLRALGTFGRLVTFGTASRQEPTPVNPSALMVGSKSIIGFWLVNAMSGRRAATMVALPLMELVTMAAQGQLKPAGRPGLPAGRCTARARGHAGAGHDRESRPGAISAAS